MSDYVQHQWQAHDQGQYQGKFARVLPWLLGTALVVSLAAYGTKDYWYPYVEPYLYRY